ncbi:MAG: hypothetical protein FJX67_13060 [Alphaproteobacteria bacterium]|nr:hypothetical protein [Alphaproteobacteria bacterium]
MIPRILHFVWVGDRKLPEKYRRNIDTWRETNPGYEVRAWTNETVVADTPYLRHCFAAGNWANASNYIRFAKVLAYGGIYLDTDVMLLGALDRFRTRRCFFGFQSVAPEKDWVNNAVFGARPGHWFIATCLRRLVADFDGSEPANHSAPRLVTRLLRARGLAAYDPGGVEVSDVTVLPQPVFYPFSWNEPFALEAVTSETVAVHFWDKTWRADAAPIADDGRADDGAAHAALLDALAERHAALATGRTRPFRVRTARLPARAA